MNGIINGMRRVTGKGIEFMLDYNLIDVYGLVEMDKKFNMSQSQRGRADVSISPIEDGIMASKLHDHAKLSNYQHQYAFDTKYYRGKKIHSPIKLQGFKITEKTSKEGETYYIRERKGIKGKKYIGDKFTIKLKDLEQAGKGKGQKYNTLHDVHKAGGFVPVPLDRGIYEWVAVIDFSKFYPNAIKSSNADIASAIDVVEDQEDFVLGWGIDEKEGKILKEWDKKLLIETPMGYFRKDVLGLNAIIFDNWLKIREEAQKDLKDYVKEFKTTKTDIYKLLWTEQFNRKNFTNAGFGVFGLPIDRNYSKFVFNSCTMMCQDIVKFCIQKLEDWGYTLIGGDTDSCFVKCHSQDLEGCIHEGKDLCGALNDDIKIYLDKVYNIQKHTIDIGLETISDQFYVDVKKHYIKRNLYSEGVILDKPELEIKGMEMKKRATSQLSADVQKGLIDAIFNAKDPITQMQNFLVDLNDNLESMDWTYVCKRAGLNKRIDDYPETNQSARAARNSMKFLGHTFSPGANPFLGKFSVYPRKFRDRMVVGNGDFLISFYEEDVPELLKAGFGLNWDYIRETQIQKKSEHLLEIFNEDFYSLIESADMGSMCLL